MGMHSADEPANKTFQVDTFVSFFTILLIVATALISVVESRAPEHPAEDFRGIEPEVQPFALTSWRFIFAYREFWLVRDGLLLRLDMPKLAEALASETALFSDPAADDLSHALAGLDPGEVKLDLRLREATPDVLIAERWPMLAPGVIERFTTRKSLEGAGAPYFFVWPDQMALLAPLLSALQDRGAPYRWSTVNPATGQIEARRSAAVFSLDQVLR